MNRLGRVRSTAEASTFSRSGHGHGHFDLKAHFVNFIDSFRREDGTGSAASSSPFLRVTPADDDDYDEHQQHWPHDHHHDRNQHFRRTSLAGSHRTHGSGERYYDLRAATTKTASTLLARELKGRHLQMIAISGSIGTGLFVASGRALSQGGPASLLLAYAIVGVMLWCTVQALGEMAVAFPVAGSFSAYSTRFLDPSWGFSMGWK
jgi:amino acid transporter